MCLFGATQGPFNQALYAQNVASLWQARPYLMLETSLALLFGALRATGDRHAAQWTRGHPSSPRLLAPRQVLNDIQPYLYLEYDSVTDTTRPPGNSTRMSELFSKGVIWCGACPPVVLVAHRPSSPRAGAEDIERLRIRLHTLTACLVGCFCDVSVRRMTYSYNTFEAVGNVESGLWPTTTRSYVMDSKTLTNTNFIAIPGGSKYPTLARNLAGALVAGNEIASMQQQFVRAQPAFFGSFQARATVATKAAFALGFSLVSSSLLRYDIEGRT